MIIKSESGNLSKVISFVSNLILSDENFLLFSLIISSTMSQPRYETFFKLSFCIQFQSPQGISKIDLIFFSPISLFNSEIIFFVDEKFDPDPDLDPFV